METGMSKAELNRVEVLALRRARAITQAEAGRQLGLSERQVRRLELRFGKEGAKGLRSGKRGRPSNRRIDLGVIGSRRVQ